MISLENKCISINKLPEIAGKAALLKVEFTWWIRLQNRNNNALDELENYCIHCRESGYFYLESLARRQNFPRCEIIVDDNSPKKRATILKIRDFLFFQSKITLQIKTEKLTIKDQGDLIALKVSNNVYKKLIEQIHSKTKRTFQIREPRGTFYQISK